MRISLSNPIIVTTDGGNISCSEAEISVAVSNSVAVRIVPVDADGNEYLMSATGVVGTVEQEDIATFMDEVASAVTMLISNRGM